MRRLSHPIALGALALLLPACESNEPLGPTPVDQGIVIFMHSGFRGSSQQIGADVTDLDRVEGPCGDTEDESSRTWNDCISSVRVLPGWRATLYGDRNFHGGTIQITPKPEAPKKPKKEKKKKAKPEAEEGAKGAEGAKA